MLPPALRRAFADMPARRFITLMLRAPYGATAIAYFAYA